MFQGGKIEVNPFLRYLYSGKNIVGGMLALLGLLLVLTSAIRSVFWPVVVAVMYGIGALLAPGPPKVAVGGTSFDPESIRRSLQRQLNIAYGKLTPEDRKSTRLNSSHLVISYAVFCLKKQKHVAT